MADFLLQPFGIASSNISSLHEDSNRSTECRGTGQVTISPFSFCSHHVASDVSSLRLVPHLLINRRHHVFTSAGTRRTPAPVRANAGIISPLRSPGLCPPAPTLGALGDCKRVLPASHPEDLQRKRNQVSGITIQHARYFGRTLAH